jgi:hypothetical protein
VVSDREERVISGRADGSRITVAIGFVARRLSHFSWTVVLCCRAPLVPVMVSV